jgi:cbb3-type cytochrome oxidase subunit 3
MQLILAYTTIALALVYLGRFFHAQWSSKKGKCGECGNG